MEYKTLHVDTYDNVTQVTLNRTEAANSLSLSMATDLMDVFMECSKAPEVRAVLISSSGNIFCSGGDLREFEAQGDNLSCHLRKITTYLHAAVSLLARMPVPVIAAVHGFAAGAGMSLACACDIVVASESARFTMAYTRAGLTPDGSSTYFLPRIMGAKRTMELVLTNRVVSAQEALEWGIVSRVVPDAELIPRARELAVQLASGPTGAFAATKKLILDSWNQTLESQMEHESQAISVAGNTADAREGIAAFLQKRQGKFTGQ